MPVAILFHTNSERVESKHFSNITPMIYYTGVPCTILEERAASIIRADDGRKKKHRKKQAIARVNLK